MNEFFPGAGQAGGLGLEPTLKNSVVFSLQSSLLPTQPFPSPSLSLHSAGLSSRAPPLASGRPLSCLCPLTCFADFCFQEDRKFNLPGCLDPGSWSGQRQLRACAVIPNAQSVKRTQ